MDLDSFDLEILNQLDMDARQPYSQIGKVLRRSKQFVGQRIKNLTEKKIIEGYLLDVDLRSLGYTLFSIFLQFQGLTKMKEKRLMEYLGKSKYVGFCIKTLGNWDLFISIRAEDINDFYEFLGNFHKFCAKSIKKESINLEVRGIATNLKFLSKNEKITIHNSANTDKPKKEIFKESEKKVLNELRKFPLITYLDLAKKCNKSYDTLKNIIKKFQDKKIIKTTRAIINTEKLGYDRYLFLIELGLMGNKNIEEIQHYLMRHKNIDYIIEGLGSWNIICDVYSRDTAELITVIDDIKSKFSAIQSIEFLKVIKNEKEVFNI